MKTGKTFIITVNTFLTIFGDKCADKRRSVGPVGTEIGAPMITTAVVLGRKPEYSDDSNICSNVSDDSTGGIN